MKVSGSATLVYTNIPCIHIGNRCVNIPVCRYTTLYSVQCPYQYFLRHTGILAFNTIIYERLIIFLYRLKPFLFTYIATGIFLVGMGLPVNVKMVL